MQKEMKHFMTNNVFEPTSEKATTKITTKRQQKANLQTI